VFIDILLYFEYTVEMVRKKFEYLNHTADLGIRVFGSTVEELFINTAQAIFEIQISGKLVVKQEIEIAVEAENLEELLIDWCRELLYNFSVHRFIPMNYDISLQQLKLSARINGDLLDLKRHKIKTDIKNVTYHNLTVKKQKNGYEATIVFDV